MRIVHDEVVCELTSLPGCDQIVVSHNVFVPPPLRNQGRGGKAHKDRLKDMLECGYNYTICTIVSSNILEKRILEDNGWKKFDSFLSTKTGNFVEIWGKPLKQKELFDPNSLEYRQYDVWEKSLERK